MLVSFEINYQKAQDLEIPDYVVNWHHVRILKEIDDIRYVAMNHAQMELSVESLLGLKKIKLLSLFNPKFEIINGVYKVSSYNNVALVYDISIDWFIKTAEEFISYLVKHNVLFDINNLFHPNHFKMVTSRDGLYHGFMPVYNKEIYDFKNYLGIVGTTGSGQFFLTDFPINQIKGKSFYQDLTDYWDSIGKVLSKKGAEYIMYYYLPGHEKFGAIDTSAFEKFWVRGNIFFFDPLNESVPEYLKLKAIEGTVATESFVNSQLIPALNYLINYYKGFQYFTFIDSGYVSLAEPNDLFQSGNNRKIVLADTRNRSYNITVSSTSEVYAQWYRLTEITKHNGKKYRFPFGTFYYIGASGLVVYPNAIGRVRTQANMASKTPKDGGFKTPPPFLSSKLKLFYDKNISAYNFAPYFPICIADGNYRLRNGILFADASKNYDLEFVFYSDSIIDQLETMAGLQEAINDIRQDIKSGLYVYESSTAKWFMMDNSAKVYFFHPITLKSYDLLAYLDDLIFDAGQIWAAVQREINAFIESRFLKNETFYSDAYQNFLRGQAISLGPDAVAEYERKLDTGIFYTENGFDYWRPFTDIELKVIAMFKSNAEKNAMIEAENFQILAQNKFYQDQANAVVNTYNNNKLQEARRIASQDLKIIADNELAKIVAPTIEYLIRRAEKEGGFPTDILLKWTEENSYYYLRSDVKEKVDLLLYELTDREQKVATALVANAMSEIEFSKALQDLFIIKE